ncbi:MAG: DUF2071 domain-containing protein [Chloroflexi bacterium]|nr:DUF2071 domain-containing protein [Chloroflexota bacterium]
MRMSGEDESHRRWPRPRSPWVMAQTWSDLLFAHWPVPVEQMRALIPDGLELDTYEGRAWVGVVPFQMSGVRWRGTPALPWLSHFPEINVRTYVTRDGKPGVYFFSLDAANRVAVTAARWLYHLPYFNAVMTCEKAGEAVRYVSHRTHRGAPSAHFRATYRPTGPASPAEPGSLADWLTARYCLYAVDGRGRAYRAQIDHPPWQLAPVEAEIAVNTMTEQHGINLPNQSPLLHFSRRLNMVAWLPQRLPSL